MIIRWIRRTLAALAIAVLCFWLVSYVAPSSRRWGAKPTLPFGYVSARWGTFFMHDYRPGRRGPDIFFEFAGLQIHRNFSSYRTEEDHSVPEGEWRARNVSSLYINVPLWMPFIVLAAYPLGAAAARMHRRRERQRRGLCLACGYDLTGNTSGRCPECGEQIKADSA